MADIKISSGRSIPSMIDGLTPGQRKVIFACIKRNNKREVSVAQLAGLVIAHSAYHHDEQLLCATIVNLAQKYTGSNNINLLQPKGQFGTRLLGGKDSAVPHHIFTLMSPVTRMIFHPHDDRLLVHAFEGSQKIEPIHYVPILPMVLVNGAEGIGNGWSTKIPMYNPREIVQNIRLMLDGDEPQTMHPWYRNFRGTVESLGDKYLISGEVAALPGERVEITELPVGTWTEDYKADVLEPMLGSDQVEPLISDYKDYSSDTTVRFVVTLLPGKLVEVEAEGIHKVFKLQTTVSMSCMKLFDQNNCLKKYGKVEEILRDFYSVRMRLYTKRMQHLQGRLQADVDRLANRARFVAWWLAAEDNSLKAVVEELIERGYAPDPVAEWKKRANRMLGLNELEEEVADSEEEEIKQSSAGDPVDPENTSQNLKEYNYLLGMPVWMLNQDTEEELLVLRDRKLLQLNTLRAKTPSMLWREDLDTFLQTLDELEEKERQEELSVTRI